MRRRFFRILAFVILATVGLNCGHEPTGSTNGAVRVRWFQPQSGYGQARPAVFGELVFFATGLGQVIARDRATGIARWAANIAGEQVSGYNFAVTDGVVAVSVSYETVGLDAQTGALLWRYRAPADPLDRAPAPPGYVVGARIAAGSRLFLIPAWGATVSALEARSGQVRWTWRSAPSPYRMGAVGVRVSSDTAFVGGWEFLNATGVRSAPWVMALETGSGRVIWRMLLPEYPSGGVAMNGAPALTSRYVIAAARGGDTWGLDRPTGRVAWYRPPDSKLATVAQAESWGEEVYVDGGDEFLYALDPSDGKVRWRAHFGGGSVTDLLATEQNVYIANGPTLTVIERVSGREVARVDAPRRNSAIEIFGSAPQADRGQAFVTVSTGAWSFDEP